MNFRAIEEALLSQLSDTKNLKATATGYALISPDPKERAVELNFETEFLQWKKTLTAFNSQPLYRALGIKGDKKPYVLDATCGLAGDSLQLLVFGCKVHSWERHPIPALMLLKAFENWHNPIKEMWGLDFLNFTVPDDVEVIYFDPMFKEANQKSLPRKEMRIFREVVGSDEDAIEVALKLQKLKRRLIIKRPAKAEALIEGVSFSQTGKAVRFDVYLPS